MEAVIRLDFTKRDCFCLWRTTRFQSAGTYRVISLNTNDRPPVFVIANRFQHGTENEIWLSSVFAEKQGLRERDIVYVDIEGVVNSISHVPSITVTPDSSNDWEILEANQELLVHSFLSQCCCVWSGMRLPLWVENICLTVTVENLGDLSSSKYAIIKEFTEVFVGMPDRPQQGIKTIDGKSINANVMVKGDVSTYNLSDASLTAKTEVTDRLHSSALRVKDKKSFVSFLISITDFVYFLWRGHTYSCLRQMDRLTESLAERFTVPPHIRTTVCRLRIEERLQSSWPIVYSNQAVSFVGLVAVIPNRCATRMKQKQQKKDVLTDEEHKYPHVIVLVQSSERCESGQLVTNELCRSLLGAAVSDSVAVTPLEYKSAHLRCVTLRLQRKENTEFVTKLRRVFYKWMRDNFSEEEPLLLFNGTVILLTVNKEEVTIIVQYRFQRSLRSDQNPPFAFLSPNMLSTGFVRLYVQLCQDVAPLSSQPRHLALTPNLGVAKVPTQMLEPSLLATCRKGLLEREFVGAVVCGPSSSGRSILIYQTVTSLQEDSHLQAHVSWVSCREWRGKAFEKFRRHAVLAVNDAVWRRPSVVVFDDIDSLLTSGRSVEQEDDTKDRVFASFFTTLFDQSLLPSDCTSRDAGSQTALIVTVESSDCLSLFGDVTLRSNGTPLFNAWVEMPVMDEEILRRVLLPQFVSHPEDFNVDSFVSGLGKNLSAFGVGDLKLLIEKENYSPSDQRESTKQSRDFRFVGGLHEAKDVLTRAVVWARRYPDIFRKCPLRPQRGVLLFGPSGCGKTLIGHALADEAGLDLITVRGPELLSKYIGASEANVRDTFARAARAAPCLLLFDDFDALAPRRGHDSTGVTDRVVNQLLTELDGAESQLDGVFVVAASNRPDMIDPALLRPGRLDLHVYCPLPNANGRREIMELLCDGELSVSFDGVETKERMVARTEGYSGADLRSLVLAARLAALRRQGLWNVRQLWSGGEEEGKRNTGIELREEAEMAVALSDEDFEAAYRQVGGSFGAGRDQKRAVMEASFVNFQRKYNLEAVSGDKLKVTLA